MVIQPSLLKRGWYLKSEKLIMDKMKGPMPASQIHLMLKNNGISADEMKWNGLDELQGKTDKMTKQQVMDYIKQNQVQVHEVIKGNPVDTKRFDFLEEKLKTNGYLSPEEQIEYAQLEKDVLFPLTQGTNTTKFSQYQLPGGENYREIVFINPSLVNDGYRSPHFPDIAGYNGHMRINDRIYDNNKKMLFIEENQNDRHQAGREEGYRKGLDKIISELSREFDDKRHITSQLIDAAKGRGFTSGELERLRNDTTAWLRDERSYLLGIHMKFCLTILVTRLKASPPPPSPKPGTKWPCVGWCNGLLRMGMIV